MQRRGFVVDIEIQIVSEHVTEYKLYPVVGSVFLPLIVESSVVNPVIEGIVSRGPIPLFEFGPKPSNGSPGKSRRCAR